jgi:hypothetical protein
MLSTLINSFDTEWIGVIHQQTPTFMAGMADECVRHKLRLSMLRKNGRIMLGASGPFCIWNVQYKQPPVEAYSDGGQLNFQRWDVVKQVALNWRGYKSTDLMTEKEYLMTQGSTGRLLNRYAEMIPLHMKAITDYFGGELILDGEATGRQDHIHGMETFLGAGTVVAADLIAQPSDSYAGLSTALGSEGGTWSTSLGVGNYPNAAVASDWPNGKGDYEYDFFAPKLGNWSSTRWGTGSTTWEANCERVIRQMIIWMTMTGGSGGRPSIATFSGDMWAGFVNHQSAKQRSMIPHKEAQDLGFPEALNFDGVAIGMDYDVPANTGYFENLKNVELMSLDRVLFGYRGPDFDPRTGSWLFSTGFWGQARYRPKHFGKVFNYA